MGLPHLRRWGVLAAAACCVLWGSPGSAWAGPSGPLQGHLKTYGYLDATRALSEAGWTAHDHGQPGWFAPDRVGLRLQLRVDEQASEHVRLVAAANLQYDARDAALGPLVPPDDGTTIFFREAYVSLERVAPWLDLKVGRQYVYWSRFEWGGALDVVSPWDLANMGAEKENFRLPVDGLRAWAVFAPVTLELLALPIFAPSRVPLHLPDSVGPLYVDQRDAVLPERTLDNGEFGVRLTGEIGGSGELGLAWFHGFDRNFSLYTGVLPDPDTGFPAGLSFTPRYAAHDVFGADMELLVGPVVVLAESAFILTEDSAGTDVFVKNRRSQTAVGFEWEPTARLRVAAHGSYTRLFDYDRQLEYDTRHDLGEPDPYVPAAWQAAATSKVQLRVTDDVSLHWLSIFNLFDASRTWDTLQLLFAAWEPYQAVKVYAGAIAFRGEEATRFGRVENQSRVFLELKHSF